MRERGEEVPAELQQAFDQAEEKLFVNVRNLFGGNIRQCVTGAAPIAQGDPRVLLRLRRADDGGLRDDRDLHRARRSTARRHFRFGSVGKPSRALS